MNGKPTTRNGICLICAMIVVAFPAALAMAGNERMVEKNIGDLDRINKEAVGQIPDLPRDGSVDLKANVKMEGDKAKVEILEKNVHHGKGVTRENIGPQESDEQKQVSAPVREENIIYRSGNSLMPDSEDEANHDR